MAADSLSIGNIITILVTFAGVMGAYWKLRLDKVDKSAYEKQQERIKDLETKLEILGVKKASEESYNELNIKITKVESCLENLAASIAEINEQLKEIRKEISEIKN